MRTGKGTRRFGGPSQAFLNRKGSRENAAVEAWASSLPRTGDVNLFLDDERLPRDGWTLVRTPEAFKALMDDETVTSRVRRLALDWYLGSGHANGDEVASDLAARLAFPSFMPNLEIVHFHSSVHEKALGMLRIVERAIADRPAYVVLDIGKPWDVR